MDTEKIPWKDFLLRAPELFAIVVIIFLYLLLLPRLIQVLATVAEYILLTIIALISGLVFLVCLYLILLSHGRPPGSGEKMSAPDKCAKKRPED